MSRQTFLVGVVLTVVALGAAGCRPQQPAYLFEDGDLSHYVGVATQIEYPEVNACSLDDVKGALPPFSLDNSKPREYWDLTLEEAIRIAMSNAKVLKVLSPAGGPSSQLLSQPSIASTIYDPAINEADPNVGVEGALSAFDAQLSGSMTWQHSKTPQNVDAVVEFFRPRTLIQDLGTFQSQLSKVNATGGVVSLSHNVNYDFTNAGGREFTGAYAANVQASVTQPFLQGAGVAYNRIAGPRSVAQVPGIYRGVMIARLTNDQSLADFEANVRNTVSDVEVAYRTLYLAYRKLDAGVAARDAALQTWRQVRAKYEAGGRGGGAQDEAQARQQYFGTRAGVGDFLVGVEQSLTELYSAESQLRYMLGVASTDGRLIRPVDELTTAKVSFDWCEVLAEALARYPELRLQKWVVKQREMELIAAKNWLLPRLDGIAQYNFNGLGHTLVDPSNSERNAYGDLVSGQWPGWELGFQFSVPLGFRQGMAGVRQAQLRLARDRTLLQEQELELANLLAQDLRDLNDQYAISQTLYNRRIAAQKEVEALQAAYDQGISTLDVLLYAQQKRALAEYFYFQKLMQYNLTIRLLHFHKGSLLEYNGVCLAEGPWPGKAYFDARRLARARDAGLYLDYGFTQPKVVSQGPVVQHAGTTTPLGVEGDGKASGPEAIPTPSPEAPGSSPMPSLLRQPGPEARSALPAGPSGVAEVARPQGAARPQEAVGRPNSGEFGYGPQAGAATRRIRYDVGANLSLFGKAAAGTPPSAAVAAVGLAPAQSSGPASSPVESAGYQQALPAEGPAQGARPSANGGWKSSPRTDPPHESLTHLPTVEADQPAPGWKRAQR